MKKIFYVLVIFLFASCEKRESIVVPINAQEITSADNEGTGSGQIIGNPGGGINCDSGIVMSCGKILEFESMQHFWNTYECLELAYENYNNTYELSTSSLSDSLFDVYSDSIGFNEDQPFINFENQFSGYYSYRRWFADEEDAWLNNTTLNPNTDPENDDFIEDDVLMTLFNKDRAVKIAGVIYWIGKDGTLFQINNGDCSLLAELQNNQDYQSSNITIFSLSNSSSDCKMYGSQTDNQNYDGNKKFYSKLTFRVWPWGTISKSKIRSYKRKSNGKWKRYKSNLVVSNYGVAYDINCDISEDFSDAKGPKRRRKLKVTYYWGGLTAQYKEYSVAGGFESNGNSMTLSLQ